MVRFPFFLGRRGNVKNLDKFSDLHKFTISGFILGITQDYNIQKGLDR